VSGLVMSLILARQSPTQRRLEAIRPVRTAPSVVLSESLTATSDPALARWSKMLPKSAKDMSRTERRLAAAGIRAPLAAVVYSVAELLVPAALLLGVFRFFGLRDPLGWVIGAFLIVLGYLAPGLYVDWRLSDRRKQIRNGLPDVLDLLIVCLEAGSSLDQAIMKASEELAIAYPALGEELRILTTETRAGKARMEAFKNLAARTKVEDVRTLVAMLAQTDRFGTSVADTLRTMADEMRVKRRQAAEETAAKVGVKLVLPLVFFLFPALYVVMLGPAVIQFIKNFPE
jgi:tight adherence protein C